MTKNRQTQMIADWLAEEGISLEGLDVQQIEEKVKGCFGLNFELGRKMASENLLYTISKVQWEELVVK